MEDYIIEVPENYWTSTIFYDWDFEFVCDEKELSDIYI